MVNHDFNIFVGAQNGYLKGINLNQTKIITKNFSQEKEQITALSWNDLNQNEILVGFKNQDIAIFNTRYKRFTWFESQPFGEGPVVSVFQNSGCIFTGVASGEVRLLQNQTSTVIKTIARDYSDCITKKPTLCRVKLDLLNTSQFATGGCENDLAVWDMNNLEVPIFRAKNVKADWLQLRVPIWISDITYLPNTNLIAISSKYNHVRLYDPRAQRKPVISFEWDQTPLTCIAAVPQAEKQVVVGTSYGKLSLFDFRRPNPETSVKCFRNFIGAVRSVVVNESSPLVLSVSLDRFVRVHNLENGNIIYKHFIKTRPNCLLVRKDLNDEDFCLMKEVELTEPIPEKGLKNKAKELVNGKERGLLNKKGEGKRVRRGVRETAKDELGKTKRQMIMGGKLRGKKLKTGVQRRGKETESTEEQQKWALRAAGNRAREKKDLEKNKVAKKSKRPQSASKPRKFTPKGQQNKWRSKKGKSTNKKYFV